MYWLYIYIYIYIYIGSLFKIYEENIWKLTKRWWQDFKKELINFISLIFILKSFILLVLILKNPWDINVLPVKAHAQVCWCLTKANGESLLQEL